MRAFIVLSLVALACGQYNYQQGGNNGAIGGGFNGGSNLGGGQGAGSQSGGFNGGSSGNHGGGFNGGSSGNQAGGFNGGSVGGGHDGGFNGGSVGGGHNGGSVGGGHDGGFNGASGFGGGPSGLGGSQNGLGGDFGSGSTNFDSSAPSFDSSSHSAPSFGPQGGSSGASHEAPSFASETGPTNQFITYTVDDKDFRDDDAKRALESQRKAARVVFIRGPQNKGLEDAALSLASQAVAKTAIYVLTKETSINDLANKLNTINKNDNNRPEVHFVKYRTPEDAANAQRAIQGQYDALGGSTKTINGGVAPSLNFASQAPAASAPVAAATPNNSYLPASVLRLLRRH